MHVIILFSQLLISPADQSKYESLSEYDVLQVLNMSSLTVEDFDSV